MSQTADDYENDGFEESPPKKTTKKASTTTKPLAKQTVPKKESTADLVAATKKGSAST